MVGIRRPAASARYLDLVHAVDVSHSRPETQAKYLASDGREIRLPAIEGYACLTETAFEHQERLVYFKAGAFIETIFSSDEKRLLFDHDDDKQFGSTKTGLEFASTVAGLAFRMRLAGSAGHKIYKSVTEGTRACVSVGVTFSQYETKVVKGFEVDIVSKATLKEISLVKQGAVPETFASVVDLEEDPCELWFAARKPHFERAKIAANVSARARRVTDAFAKLAS